MDLIAIFVLILMNGVFAMSEIAVVSARKARLQQWQDEGHSSAGAALQLANEPSHFLSTIQVGITSIGVLSGAVGEAAIADRLAPLFTGLPLIGPYGHVIALGMMVVIITYLSVVIGELVPKRLALHNPEMIASLVARPMQWLSRATFPLVRFFSASSEIVLRLLGSRPGNEPPVTEEEIKVLMEQGTEAGVFEEAEQRLVRNVFRLDEQKVGAIMTHRVDIVSLDLEDPLEEIRAQITDSPYSRLPVCKGGTDNLLGIVEAKILLAQALAGKPLDLLSSMKPPLYVPETLTGMQLLETFKKNRQEMALIVDEYGEIQGLVTLTDVLQAIVGDLPTEEVPVDAMAVRREDGSWLLDGALALDRVKEIFDVERLAGEDEGNFHTLGGFVMTQLGRVPQVADHFVSEDLRFEVVDMDRNRVDKVLVAPVGKVEEGG